MWWNPVRSLFIGLPHLRQWMTAFSNAPPNDLPWRSGPRTREETDLLLPEAVHLHRPRLSERRHRLPVQNPRHAARVAELQVYLPLRLDADPVPGPERRVDRDLVIPAVQQPRGLLRLDEKLEGGGRRTRGARRRAHRRARRRLLVPSRRLGGPCPSLLAS